MKIFKEITGHGNDLVLIHGWCGTHVDMQPLAEQLALRFRVINIDLPGVGQTDWNASIESIHDIADCMVSELPRQAIYVAWSFGGLVVQSIAARYPERVSRFIGVSTTPKFIEAKDWIGFPTPGFKELLMPIIKEKGLELFIRGCYETEFAEVTPKPTSYKKLEEVLHNRTPIDLEILSAGLGICDMTDLRKEFSLLSCPVDLIVGELDDSISSKTLELMKRLNSKIRIHVIKKAKHAPFWTHPEEFNKVLNSIL